MKFHNTALGIVSCFCFGVCSLHGEEANLSASLDQIRELLKPAASDSPEAKTLKSSMRRYPDMWKGLLESGQLSGLSEYAEQNNGADLSAVPGLNEKIQAFYMAAKSEAVRKESAIISDAEALLAKVGVKLMSAKKAEELDPLIMELSKSRIPDYGNSRKLSQLSNQLQAALQIVGNWQEYLIAEESGNSQQSRNNLEQIASQLSGNPIVPRSMVLRLLNPQVVKKSAENPGGVTEQRASTDEIQAQLTQSGDTMSALTALKMIPRLQMNGSEDSNLLRAVQSIDDLRKLEPTMSESEVFANLRTLQSNQGGRYAFNRALDQIALNAIARSYGIEPTSSQTTSARKLLETIATTAREKEDWPRLRKAINSLDSIGSGSSYLNDSSKRVSDLKILALIEMGRLAEQRNDLDAAATAYIEASVLDGQYLQREYAYGKLAALKEKAPDRIAPILAKAEEARAKAEAARYSAELESRNQMMTRGMASPYNQLPRETLTAMRPMIQEVVAEFLKEKRLDAVKPVEPEPTRRELPKGP